jgi:hypothetical protein
MTRFTPESHGNDEEVGADPEVRLVSFLQNHAPRVPEASIDLEDRLMSAITTPVNTRIVRSSQWGVWRYRSRGILVIASCSLLAYAAWHIHRLLTPNSAVGELAEVEQLWFKDLDSLTTVDGIKTLPEWDWTGLDTTAVHHPSVLGEI